MDSPSWNFMSASNRRLVGTNLIFRDVNEKQHREFMSLQMTRIYPKQDFFDEIQTL